MLKSLAVLFCFLLITFSTRAQQNLVPNPSFEDTLYCPFGTNQINACANWQNFGNSPDYFNVCNQFGMSVPNSVFGYQYAHSGNATAGIVLYRRPGQPGTPNAREFIGAELSQPLTIGVKYFLSFYINFSYHPTIALACNKAGIRFSTVLFDSCCKPSISNYAHLVTDSIYRDSIQWSKVAGSFIADSAYSFICIGNFFDDLNTDTMQLGLFPDYSYYYFDDICVTTDSIFNQTWTGLDENVKQDIFIYPNPSENTIYVSNLKVDCNYNVIDNLGKIILTGALQMESTTIDISMLHNGIYYLQLKNNLKVINKPFFKQRHP